MLRQFALGIAVSVCNIAIHAKVMVAVIQVARIVSKSATSRQSLRLTAVMSATASVLMAAHLAEVLVWSFAYSFIGVAPPGTDLIYFAFVNYMLRRRDSVAALAVGWASDGDERRAIVWLVDRCHF
jgi:hypothetical protein